MTGLFLEPLDVLFLRGNKLFGDPGSYGEALIPPWPSAAAGALRSRLLVDAGHDLAAFAGSENAHPELGTPQKPGSFTVTAFHLARRDRGGRVEILVAPPADLVIVEPDDGKADRGRKPVVRRLHPSRLAAGLASSYTLPLTPVLAEPTRSKPAGGYWLTQAGWAKYLKGETPAADDLVDSSALWSLDHRVGVGLEATTRRAADGRLFTVQAVAPIERHHPISKDEERRPVQAGYDVGFWVEVKGATPPTSGMVRLGGDGRAAAIQAVDFAPPYPDYEMLARNQRCRLVLTTPGLFPSTRSEGETPRARAGWLPTGARPEEKREDGAIRFELAGVAGWIVAAAVPRAEVVSGWDLANWQPKPALRAAPAGSV
ncbi:MAG: hypothetical protein DI596_15235, partial [Azospira oryzae]